MATFTTISIELKFGSELRASPVCRQNSGKQNWNDNRERGFEQMLYLS